MFPLIIHKIPRKVITCVQCLLLPSVGEAAYQKYYKLRACGSKQESIDCTRRWYTHCASGKKTSTLVCHCNALFTCVRRVGRLWLGLSRSADKWVINGPLNKTTVDSDAPVYGRGGVSGCRAKPERR